MKNSKLKIIIFLVIIFCIFIVLKVSAAESASGFQLKLNVKIPGLPEVIDISGATVAEYIKAIYDWSIKAIIVLAIVMIVVGGFQWIMAVGNASIIGQAKTRIGHALMGLILALGTYFILNFVNPELVKLKVLKIGNIEGREFVLGTDVFIVEKVMPAEVTQCYYGLTFQEWEEYKSPKVFNYSAESWEVNRNQAKGGCFVAFLRLNPKLPEDRLIAAAKDIKEEAKKNLDYIDLIATHQSAPAKYDHPFKRVLVANEDEIKGNIDMNNPADVKEAAIMATRRRVIVATEKDYISKESGNFPFDGEYKIEVYYRSLEEEPKVASTSILIMGATSPECKDKDKEFSLGQQFNQLDEGVKDAWIAIKNEYKRITGGRELDPTSFSDSYFCWQEHCVGKVYIGRPPCHHTQYSCHYGGNKEENKDRRPCMGKSYAIDISILDKSGKSVLVEKDNQPTNQPTEALKKAIEAAEMDDVRCLIGKNKNHIHISFGPHYGCECDKGAALCSNPTWEYEK